MAVKYRLGVDVGGTFTDATLVNVDTGDVRVGKVHSTPNDPSIGFLEAAHRILREADVAPAAVEYVVHGTTVATNAIIEGNLAPTAFVTTDGFRDMLEIQRQVRPDGYDLLFEKLRPLVPRYLCFGVPERMDAQGNVLVSLDEEAVRRLARRLRQEGVGSIAVCYLHSYINPDHERRTGEIFWEVFPEGSVNLSSEVAPEFREYFRASTTVINAGIRPIVDHYLGSIEARLQEAGLSAELLVMQSNGGVLTFTAAREKPVFMVESGPAAGVIAASYLGSALGHLDVLSIDMGGTTAKAGLIQNGAPRVAKDYEVGASAGSAERDRGSGYPIRTPVIDLVEIGAGGGSIAWVDSGGILRVGPHSAGADPGPVCYGLGGTEPTISDANLLLGRLDPDYFLGGEMELDVEGARKAIREKCADPLGLDVIDVAIGIVEIANTAMVDALRSVSIQRGYDPRDFALMAFGGAGPMQANRLAAELEIPTTLIPMSPGIFSAMGLLVTDLKHDYSVTVIERVERLDMEKLQESYRDMQEQGRRALLRDGVRPEDISFLRQVDMRYVGQSYEIPIPLGDTQTDVAHLTSVLQRFHQEHERAYGFSAPEEPVEVVTLRLTAVGNIAKPRLRRLGQEGGDASSARRATRPVYFAETAGFIECPIYDRYRLGPGSAVRGPSVVEEIDSTTVIHPGYMATVDEFGNMFLTESEQAE